MYLSEFRALKRGDIVLAIGTGLAVVEQSYVRLQYGEIVNCIDILTSKGERFKGLPDICSFMFELPTTQRKEQYDAAAP